MVTVAGGWLLGRGQSAGEGGGGVGEDGGIENIIC